PSRWPGGETRAPAGPEIPASPPDRPGSANSRVRRRPPAAREPQPSPDCSVRHSSVASGATCKRSRILYLVFRHQAASSLLLIARRLVAHGSDEFARPQVSFGVAVTVETPLHLERVFLPGERHPVDPAMAALTTYPLVDMN